MRCFVQARRRSFAPPSKQRFFLSACCRLPSGAPDTKPRLTCIRPRLIAFAQSCRQCSRLVRSRRGPFLLRARTRRTCIRAMLKAVELRGKYYLPLHNVMKKQARALINKTCATRPHGLRQNRINAPLMRHTSPLTPIESRRTQLHHNFTLRPPLFWSVSWAEGAGH